MSALAVMDEPCVLCGDSGWIPVDETATAVVFKGVWDAGAEQFFLDGKRVKYDPSRTDLFEERTITRSYAKRCICAPVGSADHPAGSGAIA